MNDRLLAGCLLGVCVGTAALTVRAQDSVDGPNRPFRDELVENLVGDWKITRKIHGREVENSLQAEWVLQHQFLQLHMKDVADPPTYEAIVLIGYVNAEKRYVAYWCDTTGGQYSGEGHGIRSGNQIEFRFDFADGPFFNTFTWDATTKGWTFLMESVGKDGARVRFAEDVLRRPK
jgi:uncharacterized protein DUF1579